MRSIASAKSSSARRASSVVFCSMCKPHDQCADAGADAKANEGSDDGVVHWRLTRRIFNIHKWPNRHPTHPISLGAEQFHDW